VRYRVCEPKYGSPQSIRAAAAVAIMALAPQALAQNQISYDTVKLGVLTDMSSLYADNSGPGSVAAAQMAVADFGNTVLGKKIEVLSADNLNKPDVGAGVARRWIDSEGVDAIGTCRTLQWRLLCRKSRVRPGRYSWPPARRRLGSPLMFAPRPPCIGPMTPTRWRTAQGRQWSPMVAIPGFSFPQILLDIRMRGGSIR
jgi:hypothetical protein